MWLAHEGKQGLRMLVYPRQKEELAELNWRLKRRILVKEIPSKQASFFCPDICLYFFGLCSFCLDGLRKSMTDVRQDILRPLQDLKPEPPKKKQDCYQFIDNVLCVCACVCARARVYYLTMLSIAKNTALRTDDWVSIFGGMIWQGNPKYF